MASPKNLSPVHSSSDVDEESTFLDAMQLVYMSVLPMALKSAIELGILDAISSSTMGLSAAEVSASLPRQHADTPQMMERLLAMLASYGILTCELRSGTEGMAERAYRAGPIVKFFAKDGRGEGGLLAPLALFINSTQMFEICNYSSDAIMDGGIPFNISHGMSFYEMEKISNMLFNKAMDGAAIITMKGILESYNGFDNVNVLVDVGGGSGRTLQMIIEKHPHINAINFDLPDVISNSQQISGVKYIAGDMFESIPHGDAIVMKWILHNWSDEQCVKLLKNCLDALEENGKVIIMDYCLPLHPELTKEAQHAFKMDLAMMQVLPGKERNKQEFESIAKKAGFSRMEVVCKYAAFHVFELYK